MKRLFALTICLGTIFLSIILCKDFGSLTNPNKTTLIEKISNDTVALVYQADNKDLSIENSIHPICSGIWISETEILTAFHCVEGLHKIARSKQEAREQTSIEEPACDPLGSALGLCSMDQKAINPKIISIDGLAVHFVMENEVEGLDREPNGIHLSRAVKFDAGHDLALLKSVGKSFTHGIAKIADKNPLVGDKLVICGHTQGFYWSVLHGWVSGYRDQVPNWMINGPFMQVQAPIFHGNSGGGAFDMNGDLIGVAEMMMVEVPNMSMFVGLETVRLFIDKK